MSAIPKTIKPSVRDPSYRGKAARALIEAARRASATAGFTGNIWHT